MPKHPKTQERGRSPPRKRAGTPEKKMSQSPQRTPQPEPEPEGAAEPTTPQSPQAEETIEVGQCVEVEKFANRWYVATVLKAEDEKLFVHYEGWSEKWDEWIDGKKARLLTENLESRLTHQHRTRSPSPGPRRRVKGDTAAEPAHTPVRTLSQVINLGEIKGRAPEIFTERIDNNAAAVIVVNQACAVDSGVEVLAAARKAQIHIIHVTLHSHTSNGSDLEYFKQRTIGDEHGKLKNQRNVPAQYSPAPGEAVLFTTTTSAFASTGLEQILKNMHVVYPIFIGSFTDGCLGLTAADSISRGFLPTVVSDASIGTCKVSHLSMLRMFDQHWGRVKSAEGQIAEIQNPVADPAHAQFPRKPRLAPAHMSPRAQRAQDRHAKNAAVMVQTAWRGKSERMKRQEETEAAKKIQAVARGNAARKNYPPPVPTDESSEDEPGAPPTDPYAHELEQKGSRRTGVPTVSGEEHNVRELLLQSYNQETTEGRVRLKPYEEETTFSMTKPANAGFGIGLIESVVTGMMTVNKVTIGGVAEAAGIKEGFVLMKLGGHDLLQGQQSFVAAQEAIQPLLPGPIDWVFSHPSDSHLAALDQDGDGKVDCAELLNGMLDGSALDANIDINKAGLSAMNAGVLRQPPPVPTASNMTPTPKPAATPPAKPWKRLSYLGADEQIQKVKSLDEARQLVAQNTLRPETLVWRKGMEDWEHLEDCIDQLEGLELAKQG